MQNTISVTMRVERPWGNYEVLCSEKNTQTKRVQIQPGKRLSLQKHLKRSEKWIVVSGLGEVTLGDSIKSVTAGSFVEIPCGVIHRMHNVGVQELVFIEVQFGDYLGEDDIIRYEDDFGRK